MKSFIPLKTLRIAARKSSYYPRNLRLILLIKAKLAHLLKTALVALPDMEKYIISGRLLVHHLLPAFWAFHFMSKLLIHNLYKYICLFFNPLIIIRNKSFKNTKVHAKCWKI